MVENQQGNFNNTNLFSILNDVFIALNEVNVSI